MKKWVGMVSLSALLLGGCTFGDSAEQQIAEVLQQMHTAEEGYRSVQSDMTSAEQEEYKLFEEILGLDQEQTDELTAKVEELQALVSKRKELLATERASMEEALAASDFTALDIEETEMELASEIDTAYEERFSTYDEVYANYEKLIELQENLYAEMVTEDVSIETIRELIQQVNAQNEVVQQTVESMNAKTEEFNATTDRVFETLKQEE
ncbi:YkyA family protein [Chryseomicrobium excrementi]|nr:YkyA family protein [Chryseomicrobium excrementi]